MLHLYNMWRHILPFIKTQSVLIKADWYMTMIKCMK